MAFSRVSSENHLSAPMWPCCKRDTPRVKQALSTVGRALFVERPSKRERRSVRRLEDGVVREMGLAAHAFDVDVTKEVGDGPQTSAGAHRNRHVIVVDIIIVQAFEPCLLADHLPRLTERDQYTLIATNSSAAPKSVRAARLGCH